MDLNGYIDFLTATAMEAMVREVEIAPKPGLVDRLNSGSHEDMDIDTFLASAKALEPHFKKFMEISLAAEDDLVLPLLRKPGMDAEKDMFTATGGANTHKGLIFSLGLVAACLVRLALRLDRKPESMDLDALEELIRMNAAGITKELQTAAHPSHGQRVYIDHGLKGVRQEAEEGFPAALHTGLPALKRFRSIHVHPDLPALLTLMALIVVTDDTNIVRRGGLEGLSWMRGRAQAILDDHMLWSTKQLMEELLRFDQSATYHRLSPGGAADNLALALFLDLVLS